MRRGRGKTWVLLLLAGLLPGCGISQNPSYFPHLVPTGDIIRTHGKPPGPGYYANFDPHACRVEVRPLEASNPVRTQHVLIATVYDKDGQARRNRRVEWLLEGVGHIVEVDESGVAPGRGYKVDNRYAVSYTDYNEHVITRGNNVPDDDFVIRPGQSWCVISSPVEGDTHVTVYCPEIFNWDQHKVTVTKHWINAAWTIPPPAVNRIGSEHVFTTNIYRLTDRMPVANYRVRYTVLSGPPAVFRNPLTPGPSPPVGARGEPISPLPLGGEGLGVRGFDGQAVAEVLSDPQGNASVTLVQTQPQGGVNRIGIEIIRPPEPGSTSPGIIIGRGETFKEWIAPNIQVTKAGPPTAAVGQSINYTITVTNTGRVETEAITVRDTPPPEGLTFLSSQPAAMQEGRELLWTLGGLAPGQSATIQATFRGDRVGTFVNTVVATSAEGLRAENNATVQITSPALAVTKTAPATAVVGTPVTYTITVTNPGSGPATNINLIDEFDPGLEHQSGANPVQLDIGTLSPGQSRSVQLALTPRRSGQLVNRVTATADGGLREQATHTLTAALPKLTISKSGPAFRYAKRPAEWNITVTNNGEVAVSNVVVRDQLPTELSFVQAEQGGQLVGGQVVWNLGTLQPGERRTVQVTTRAEQLTPRAINVATVTAEPGVQERAEAAIEIRGIPAFMMEAIDTTDPVEVGGRTTYEIRISNTGSLVGNGIQITAFVPPQLRALSGTGPVQPKIEGNKVTFPAVDGLVPGKDLLYSVTVEAVQVGDVRFRVELRSTSLGPDPVIEEEPTNVYRPIVEPGPAPAKPPADKPPMIEPPTPP